jgi:hypothetical protein
MNATLTQVRGRARAREGRAIATALGYGARVLLAFFRRRAAVVVAIAAILAAAALYMARDRRSQPELPEYALVVDGGGLVARGDAPFEIALRPASNVAAKVVVYVFAIGEGEPNPVDAKIEITPDGAVRIAGRARALAGAREVRVVVGGPAEFKRYEDALARARDGKSDAQVRVLSVAVAPSR